MQTKQPQSLIQTFIKFVTSPDNKSIDEKQQELKQDPISAFQKMIQVFRIFGSLYLINIFLSLLLSSILLLKGIQDQHRITTLIAEDSIWPLFLLACLYAPVVEELTFRFWLKFSAIRFATGSALLVFTIFNLLLNYEVIKLGFLNNLRLEIFALFQLASIVCLMAIFYIFVRQRLVFHFFDRCFDRYFGQIFYFSTFIFGAIHLVNFTNLAELGFLSLILFLPQLVSGLFLGFTRIKYGILWSMFLHFLVNFLSLCPIFIFKLGSAKLQNLALGSNQPDSQQAWQEVMGLEYYDQLFFVFSYLFLLTCLVVCLGITVFNLIEFTRKPRQSGQKQL